MLRSQRSKAVSFGDILRLFSVKMSSKLTGQTLKLHLQTVNQMFKTFFRWMFCRQKNKSTQATSVTSSPALKVLNAAVWEAPDHAH